MLQFLAPCLGKGFGVKVISIVPQLIPPRSVCMKHRRLSTKSSGVAAVPPFVDGLKQRDPIPPMTYTFFYTVTHSWVLILIISIVYKYT